MILDESSKRFPVRGHRKLVARAHNRVSLRAPVLVLREVEVHLVAVKIRVVRGAVRIVHADRALPFDDASAVRHHPRLVQRRLAIDEKHVAILKVSVDGARLREAVVLHREQRLGHRLSLLLVEHLEIDDVSSLVLHSVRAWVNLVAVDDELAEMLDVLGRHELGVGERASDEGRHPDLIRVDERVRGDDGPRRVVDTLAHHVHPKHSLLLLEQLTDAFRAHFSSAIRGRIHHRRHRLLKLEPRAENSLLAVRRVILSRRFDEIRQPQIRLNNRLELPVLHILKHQITHLRRRPQLVRRHQQRLHEEPPRIRHGRRSRRS
mmetsp:Transcript_12143/g.39928  ORF Transcript_12143/g.39928 Transcript_12143/m.39928 type:complete len:320 (+) Transcript_12143:4727-5686(+)